MHHPRHQRRCQHQHLLLHQHLHVQRVLAQRQRPPRLYPPGQICTCSRRLQRRRCRSWRCRMLRGRSTSLMQPLQLPRPRCLRAWPSRRVQRARAGMRARLAVQPAPHTLLPPAPRLARHRTLTQNHSHIHRSPSARARLLLLTACLHQRRQLAACQSGPALSSLQLKPPREPGREFEAQAASCC